MAGPKKRGGISVDFTDVESGGRSLPDGEYLMEVVSIEEKVSGEGNDYLAWKWKVSEGTYKGVSVYDNTSLKPTALWRLKGLLECLGEDVSGKMTLDIKSYLGKKCPVIVANETYQGKQKPRITEFLREMASSTAEANKKEAPKSKFKKGQKVSFDYEGEQMEGEVTSLDDGKIIVMVEVDGSKEEWELMEDELTAV